MINKILENELMQWLKIYLHWDKKDFQNNSMADVKHQRISIRRPSNSLDGQLINYLRSKFSGLDADYSEVILSTLKKHWLPLFLMSSGVQGEELRQTAILAARDLEAQAAAIREICGVGAVLTVASSPIGIQMTSPNTDSTQKEKSIQSNYIHQEVSDPLDNDDDEQLLEMQWTEEMIEANKALGVSKPSNHALHTI